MVFDPAVFKLMLNIFVPLVSVEDEGSVADPSLEVTDTVPAYPVTALLLASFAVTVKLNEDPDVELAGTPDNTNCVAVPGFPVAEKVVLIEVPCTVAVTTLLPALLPKVRRFEVNPLASLTLLALDNDPPPLETTQSIVNPDKT